MKKDILSSCLFLASLLSLTACHDNETEHFNEKGACKVIAFNGPEQAYMGDSISFTFQIEGNGPQMNQSKIQLFYGESIVSERFLLTPKNGEYSGKLFIPFIKDMVDGEVNLKLRIQNERYANAVSERALTVIRPKYEKLILTDSEGNSYDMLPSADVPYEYSVTNTFPSELYATIEAPKYGENGNTIIFGSADGKITNGSAEVINFTSDTEGVYTVSFNTLTYEGSPFIKFALNDIEFEKVDETHYKVDIDLKQGQDIKITGLKADYDNYWVNPAFFRTVKGTNGKTLRFMGRDGKYRITVDKSLKYFRVEVLNNAGSGLANLNNGDDVIWCNGDNNIGQPSYSKNGINWSTGDKVICLAPIGNQRHQLILQAGKSINKNSINFKFFYQKGWGGEFTANRISLDDSSSWFRINASDGNIRDGATKLSDNKYYVITIDISEGAEKAKMYVNETDGFKEEEPLPIE